MRFCGAVDDWAIARAIFEEVDRKLGSLASPSRCFRAWAIHKVTDAAADEDLNIWRTLRAASYFSYQRRLLEKTRDKNCSKIVRFFVTPRPTLSLRALAILANQRYLGIDVFHVFNSGKSLFNDFDELLLAHCGEDTEIDITSLPLEVEVQSRTDLAVVFHASPEKIEAGHDVRAFVICWSEQGGDNLSTNLLNQLLAQQREIESEMVIDGIRRIDEVAIDTALSDLRDQPWRWDGRAGSYLAFRVARSRIERAKTIRAIDKTSVKRSLTLLRQNPGYQEWQEAQIRAIKRPRASLKRIFILKSEDESKSAEFRKVLSQYFRHVGRRDDSDDSQMVLPDGVELAHTTEARIEKEIRAQSDLREWEKAFAQLTELIKDRDQLYSKAGENINDEGEYLVQKIKAIHVRDFLYTDNMIYDYINPDADVDLVGPGDYLLFTEHDQRLSNLKALYDRIFDFVWDCKIALHCKMKYSAEFGDD